jgi:peptidoglycan/LPS O-acetylase OafA/YrhL
VALEPASTQPRLRRLECLRGAAAFYVFLHHYVHVVVTPHAAWAWVGKFFKFGQFAVLLFFVVSGFVIYYSSIARDPELGFRAYFIRRFRRIYPPFLLALLITWIAECVYQGTLADPMPVELLGNVLMLQDTNVASWFEPYLRNAALWSLSYEWAFYLMFFATHLALKDREHLQKWLVVLLSVIGFGTYWIAGNQISLFLMYYPIWWAGVEIARELVATGDVTLRKQLVPLGNLALMCGLWAIPVYLALRSGTPLVMWKHPVIEFRHFVTAGVILVAGLAWHRMKWIGFYRILGQFERVAPISYGLYIVHYPIVHIASKYAGPGTPWLPFVWVLPTVLFLAWVVEGWIQPHVVRWLPAK